MFNSKRSALALFLLTVLTGTLTGVAAATDALPPDWRPLATLGGIIGTSLSGALTAFAPQLRAPKDRE